MSKFKLLGFFLSLSLLLSHTVSGQVTYLVNDAFNDTDRIGGTDGSSTSSSSPTINTATSTNTQWVVSRVNQMVASSSGMLWTQDTSGSVMALGYFPDVTVAAGVPVTLTLNFTTGNSGTTPNNVRIALVNGTPSGFRTTDGVSTGSDATNVDDVGYGIFSASSNVGGGNTVDLVLRTYKRIVTTSQAILSTSSDWGGTLVSGNNTGPLAASSGSTGYLEPNTSYSLQVVLSYDGTDLTITTSLTGGNFVGLSYVATDSSGSPTLTFNELGIRCGSGSGEFDKYNITSLTVTTPQSSGTVPSISTQPSPASQTVNAGSNVTYSVTASGSPSPSYQWKLGSTDLTDSSGHISGATTSSLTLTNVQAADAGSYAVVVSNTGGSTTSDAVTLAVTSPPSAPTATAATGTSSSGFTANWDSVTDATGYRLDVATDNAFSSYVTGYQDLDVGTNVSQAVAGLSASTSYYYRVRAVNGAGTSASSNTVTATTGAAAVAPSITTQPTASQTVNVGDNASFSVVASGTATLTYQWKKDGTDLTDASGHISGSTTDTLSLTSVLATDAGTYTVVVTNTGGSDTSTDAVLTVLSAPSAPTATAATGATTSGFAANWGSVSGATGYRVDVATDSSFTSYVTGYQDLDAGDVVTLNVTGLSADTSYYYRVRAYNTVGTSASSNTITAMTASAVTNNSLLWSAYDTTGAIVGTQNQAGTFDAGTGAYTFTVPAGQQYTFVTTNFVPVVMTTPGSGTTIQTVSYQLNSTSGWTGAITGNRINQVGLFDYGSTPPDGTAGNFSDDNGLWGDLKGGTWGNEVFGGVPTAAGLIVGYQSTVKLGSGKSAGTNTSWTLVDNTPVVITVRIALNSSGTFSLGTSSSYANAGIVIEDAAHVGDGTSFQAIYSGGASAVTAPHTFNEFAFYFRNDSATDSTLTLSNLTGLTAPPYFAAINGEPPATLTGSIGDNLSISVNALGSAIAYQWQKSTDGGTTFDNLDTTANPTAATATLTLSTVQNADAGQYRVIISNDAGSNTSTVCTVSVTSGAVAPSVQTDPQAATILVGGSNTFSVSASGTAPLTYQWQVSTDSGSNWTDISGATSSTYTLANAQLSDTALYRVVVTNGAGTANSASAALTVNQVPAFTTQPTGGTLHAGDALTLTAAATGTPTPTYQWQLNGVALTGATSASYAITNATGAATGNYTVVATNAAGTTTSATATVNVLAAALDVSSAAPAPGATGVFPDQPLTLTFNQAIAAGLSGTIKIYDSASPGTPVDTIDFTSATARTASTSKMALPVQTQSIGGQAGFNYYPVTISGSTLTIYPRNGTLTYGKTYYVTMDPGVIVDATGATFAGASDSTTWSFTTKASGPSSDATTLTVAADGSGDFRTVQGALDFIPAANTTPITIDIKNGTYWELVSWTNKSNLTFVGESRDGVIIGYPNNNTFNPGGTAWRAAFTCRGGGSTGLTFTNLTIRNFTAKTGSQAEALYLSGSATAMAAVLTHVSLYSYQDTLLINGQAYIADSYIEGDTDFMWGNGPVYFTNCELKALSIQSYYTQIRNPSTNHGFVYVNCTFDAAAADSQNPSSPVSGCYLGRLDQNANPHTEVVLINGLLGDHILPVAWNLNGQTTTAAATTNCAEYNSRDLTGTNLIDVSQRATWSYQWSSPANDTEIAHYSDAVWVLNTDLSGTSNGSWTPTLKPIVTTQPADTTLTAGTSLSLTVAASAIPAATYQWNKDGTPITGATAATYTVATATTADSGSYTVDVTNSAGTTSSNPATVTVNPAPASPSITTQPQTQTVNAGANVSFTVAATGDAPLSYQWKLGGSDITGATSDTYTIASAQASDAGSYTVTITNGAGSATSDAAVLTVITPPSAPTATAATSITTSGFAANWDAVSGAAGYRLDVATDSGFSSFVTGYQDLDMSSALTASLTGLSANTDYYYRVRAYNGAGTSASSNTITAHTTAISSGGTQIFNETFPLPSATYPQASPAATLSDGLTIDTNGFPTPTATQGVWASFGTANVPYVQSTSLGVSGGSSRGIMAYFVPSTTTAGLSVGEKLTVTLKFAYNGGTLAENPGNLRIGLLNSGGNGTANNIGASARYTTGVSNSLTGTPTGNTARGYSGYIVDTEASTSTTTDTISFWQRTAATSSSTGSTQILGPTGSSNLSETSTFSQIGANGGGSVGAITNDGTVYTATITATLMSDTEMDLTYTLTTDAGTVMSYSVNQTSGTLDTSFDSLMFFSTFGGAPTISGLTVTKGLGINPVAITTQPTGSTVNVGDNASFSVTATGDNPTYQWYLGSNALSDESGHISGATTATLSLTNVQASDAGSYTVVVSNAGGPVTSNAATLTVIAPPSAPTATAATNTTSTGFTANWNSVTDATGYRLDVSTDNTFSSFVTGYQDLDAGTNLTMAVTGLSANTTYYYRVRATNANGTSANSNTIVAATAPGVTSIFNETFPLPSATYPQASPAATLSDGLAIDTNGFPTPTATQGVWASFGTANVPYVQGTSLGVSGGSSRGLMAYFMPSTSTADLSVGDVLTVELTFSYNGGTLAEHAGNLRLGLLNSGGSGTANNVGGSARYTTGVSNSLTGTPTGNTARGYSGYIVDSEAATTSSTDTLSFWLRTAAASSSTGSTQIAGPTGSSDLSETSTFSQIGAYGGGTVGAIMNDGTVYTATITATLISDTELDLTYTVKTGSTTVMSYSVNQTTGSLVTSFDSLMFFSTFGAAPTISGLTVSKSQVVIPIAISTQPMSSSIGVGNNTTLTVVATGSNPIYQWYKGTTALSDDSGHISGSTTAALTITSAQLADTGDYTVVVSNSNNSVTSDIATLTVVAGPVAPTITTAPQSATVATGSDASFSVVAAGTAPLTYQWSKDGTAISGATSSTLSLSNVQLADAGSYTVTITNDGGTITSDPAVLTVTPAILTQPRSQTALAGSIATFNVVAAGAAPLTYQWSKDGTALTDSTGHIAGSTTANLTVAGLSANDAGNYTVVVSNSGGSITSSAAVLTVDTTTAKLPTQPTGIPSTIYNILDSKYSSYVQPAPAGQRVAESVGGGGRTAQAVTDYAPIIQAAINDALAHGGGIVEIPADMGTYPSGPITLGSKINLQIDGGATLQALPYGTYPAGGADFVTVPSGASDVAVTGSGTIDGNGAAWWTAYNSNSSLDRPRLLQFTRATNVLISGITLLNSPQFHIALSSTNNNVTIVGVTITADPNSPNTDGIDPAGTNILIQNCTISVGDDNIAVKASNAACANITVAYCTFGTGHGLSVGGQSTNGLDGMTVTNCTFTGTTSGLRLKADATQGGVVKNLSYSNITMTNVQYPIVFYSYYNEVGSPGATSGSSQTTPTKVNTRNAGAIGGSAIPSWQNITITNLTSTRTSGSLGYSIIWGLPLTNALISNVTLNGVNISGSAGFEIYNATGVQFLGSTSVGTLVAGNALAITGQPQNQTATAGGTATFTVTTAGTSGVNSTAPAYQWKFNDVALVDGTQPNGAVVSGATTATLTISNVGAANALAGYTCTVSNKLDGYSTTSSSFATDSLPVSTTSAAATLAVTGVSGTGTAPTITTQPTDQSINAGDTATFTVVATSDVTITAYEWQKQAADQSWSDVAGATSDTFTVTNAQTTDAGIYRVLVWNANGSTASQSVTLTVRTAPAIVTQPTGPGQAQLAGGSISLTVEATGASPLTYQWWKDGVAVTDTSSVTGSTTATLTLNPTHYTDTGTYAVVISNDLGTVTSNTVTLTINDVPPAPVAGEATGVTSSRFMANWSTTPITTGYLLDVSTSSDFSSFLPGYENLDVGTALSHLVTALMPTTTYYYRVRAQNAIGVSANSATITVTTTPVLVAPAIVSLSNTTFTVGIPSSFTVVATGSPAPTYSATGLPSWATLDATTGVLSGTAPTGTAGAQIPLTLTASNGVAPDAAQVFTLYVQAPPAATTPMTLTTIAGQALASGTTDGTGTAAQFGHLSAVAVDANNGNIYIADTDNETIRRITSAGVVTTFAGLAGTSGSANGSGQTARFNSPTGIAVDSSGSIYVADTLNDTIRRITSSGVVATLAGSAGTPGSADDGDVAGTARFSGPQGMAYDATGNYLYIADTNNHTIRKLAVATGKVSTVAGLAGQSGSVDGTGTAARFNYPSDVAIDVAGNLYVADTDNNAIRVITPNGQVRTLAGLAGSSGAADGTGSAARFRHPSAVAVDGGFNVYVLDSDNHTVRKIASAAGVVTTVAGTPGTSGSADGTGSAAGLNEPTGIIQASTGEFYIADTNNFTVREGVFPSAPTITSQPQSTSVTSGATVQFSVTATGQPAPTYQWYFNNAVINGATSSVLVLSNVQRTGNGQYTVVVSNASGSVTSNAATLTVSEPPSSGGVGGGGGGAPSLGFYAALALLGLARWLRSRRRS